LLRADDARPDVRVPFRFDRALPRFRKIIRKQQLRTRRHRSIISLSILLQPFTAHALDLAGAQPIKPHVMVWVAFTSSIFPVLCDWGEWIWPNEMEYARRVEQRNESLQLRDLAISLESSEVRPFLAPWWF
jgi:hypothetical protein